MTHTPLRRLPLHGASNIRDIGGYTCTGGTIRWGAFLRGDNPSHLTEEDITLLQNYGVRCVVDLRRAEENKIMPSSLYDAPGFTVHQISLNDKAGFQKIDFEGDVPGSMSGLYRNMLDESAADIARVMRVFIEADGGFLFHCAVGKDRTGLIALLLHKLAGVDDTDAIADYSLSEVYTAKAFEAQRNALGGDEIPDFIFRSLPISARRTLAHLQDVYGGTERYLQKAGLAPHELDALRKKLVAAE